MKVIQQLVFSLLLFILPQYSSAQWSQLTTGTTNPIYCVRYQTTGEVWAGSYNGIYRSTNSGATFNFVNGLNATLGNSQIFGSFDDIHVTGPNSAVAIGFFYLGNDLIVFGTANNGASWSHNYYSNSGSLLRYLEAFDFDASGNGVAVGDVGRVLRSSNNGSTWIAGTSGTTGTLYDVSWVNATNWVMVSGNNIYRSVNSGTTWSSVLSGQVNIENVSFAHGTTTGYAGGYNELKKTTDGGLTWTDLVIPQISIRCIYTYSPDTVYLGTNDALYRSTTGGLYWERFDMPGIQKINDVYFYDNNNGMVAGDSGYVAKTSNGGGLAAPVSNFSLTNTNLCEGSSFQPANLGDPSWTYEWWLDGVLISTQYAPTLTANTTGSVYLALISSNNGNSDTASVTLNVTALPVVTPFSVMNDTICQNGQGHFYIPNSQIFVTYTLFDGTVQVGTSQAGNGNTLTLTTNSNQTAVKPYRIRAIYTNPCGSDTLEVLDSLMLAEPAANVSAMLYRDTICTGDTTTMLIYNSEPGWEYYCSNNTFLKVDGNGGTIGIPVGPVTSGVMITVSARFKSLNCIKPLPGSFPLTYRSTSVSVPGTLQGATGQAVNMNAISTGFNTWNWDFGVNATPASGSGQIPSPPIYAIAGIDTVTLTAKLDNTCEKVIRKPVYVYGNLPVSTTINCASDTLVGTIGTTSYKYCLDDFNNLHGTGFNAQSTNFAFTPYVFRLDSSGGSNIFTTYNASGNSTGAQGLINGITSDRLTNTYFATHYKAYSHFDIQNNYIRNPNAIVKLNDRGVFQWAIEAPRADFSDMITIDNRIFAIGVNAWNGTEFQTPGGFFQYTPSISNKGDAFIMELNPEGKILSFDAFGGSGAGGVSTPAKFKVKYPIMNFYGDFDTLRQNLMLRKSSSGGVLIGGCLDASTIGNPIHFNNQLLTNSLPVGASFEKCLFIAQYDLTGSFTNAVSLMCGQPEFIIDYKETSTGHFVFAGRAKNKLITSQGTLTFPVQNYEYQYVASFSAAGTLDWMMYADSMTIKSLGTNPDGSVTVLAFMATKYLIVDGTGQPFNVSPTPATGTFLLRFGSNGELLSADRTSGFAAITLQQDGCGNHIVYHSTGSPQQYKIFRTIYSNTGNCGSNCYAAYDPNLKDVALEDVLLSDVSTSGSSVRNMTIKVKSKSVIPITSLEVNYHINNDPVQTLTWSGNILTGDSIVLTVNGYNFNKTYNRIRVWIDKVNGSLDDKQENDTIIKSQIICISPLAGTYSTGCDTCYFDNIQASATTLKTCGVSDPVKIAIEPGLYLEQIRIDSIPFASNSDSIVWTSRTGNTEDVQIDLGCDYTYFRNPIFMFHAHYCTLDHLTIRNSLPKVYDTMQSQTGGQSVINMEVVDNINVTNCSLTGTQKSSAVGGIGDIISCYLGSNMRILNNELNLGSYALRMGNSTYTCRNVIIQNNRGFQNNGFTLYNADSLYIDHNEMKSIGNEYATAIGVLASDSITITNNLVTNENWSDPALQVSCTCQPVSPCLIANNIFASAPLWLPFPGSSISGSNVDVINNSFGQGVEIYSSGGFRFVNNLVRSNGSFVIDMNSSTWMTAFNNNRYRSNGGPITFLEDGDPYTLAGWRTLTGFDMQSDSVIVDFTTLTDLHLRNATAMPGIPWPGISTDIDGQPRSGSTPTIGADEFSSNPYISEVWPGDCDSSKLVDNFDLLPIGLYYNRFSTSRPNEDAISWSAQPSLLWSEIQSNGTNLNHADANGDGWIDLEDTTVVIGNYGQSRPLANPDPQRPSTGPDLAIVPVGTIFNAGDTVHLKVMAGTAGIPIQQLSAIGFKVTLPPTLIVPGTFNISIANNWLCPDSNCIMYPRADENTGIAAVSLARLDGDQVSAYGELADISFVINAAYTGSTTITIPVSDYRSYEPDAVPIPLSPVSGTIQVVGTSIAEHQLMEGILLFPNPTGHSSQLMINWKGSSGERAEVLVTDLSGREVTPPLNVTLTNGPQQLSVNSENLLPGVYLVRLTASGEQATLRLIKQ